MSKDDNYVLYSVHHPFLKYLAQQNLNIFVVVYLRRRQLRKEKPGSSRLFRHVVKKPRVPPCCGHGVHYLTPVPHFLHFHQQRRASDCYLSVFFFSALWGKKAERSWRLMGEMRRLRWRTFLASLLHLQLIIPTTKINL